MDDIDLKNLGLALAISSGVHSLGHDVTANEVGIPLSIDWKNRVENWNPYAGTPQDQARIHAGGFAGQDLLAEMLGGDYRTGAGLYKLGYLSRLTLPKGYNGQKIEGDVNSVERLTGNKYYSQMLLADALSDIFFDTNKQSISTKVTDSGTPVLMYNRRF
jgi:hypothetical protein